ncbi:MAG: prepilin-type N-terminal cleavage/methylation domain-containing protein [Desulfuromonadaceae bacterium]|nr:prepilin-type N-terminal cleavage/methylation domain-containing protein [Desulfuromonadaceae bacterium]
MLCSVSLFFPKGGDGMMRRACGFTLLEVVVTVAVMGIMLTIALPALKPFWAGTAQKEAARNVLGALRFARSNAISNNLEYHVAFDLDTQSYWLEEGDLPSDSNVWNRIREFGSFPAGVKMATGSTCDNRVGDGDPTTADNVIQFNPNGTCGSSGMASARYICVLDTDETIKFKSGLPSSITGRAIIKR